MFNLPGQTYYKTAAEAQAAQAPPAPPPSPYPAFGPAAGGSGANAANPTGAGVTRHIDPVTGRWVAGPGPGSQPDYSNGWLRSNPAPGTSVEQPGLTAGNDRLWMGRYPSGSMVGNRIGWGGQNMPPGLYKQMLRAQQMQKRQPGATTGQEVFHPGGRGWGESRPGEAYYQVEGPGNPSWEARNPQYGPGGGKTYDPWFGNGGPLDYQASPDQKLDIGYSNWLRQQAYPMEMQKFYGNMGQQLLGSGLAGAGLYDAVRQGAPSQQMQGVNPMYGQIADRMRSGQGKGGRPQQPTQGKGGQMRRPGPGQGKGGQTQQPPSYLGGPNGDYQQPLS